MRFLKGVLISFDFAINFLKSELAVRLTLPAYAYLTMLKETLIFLKFSSLTTVALYEIIMEQIAKMFLPNVVRFYHSRACHRLRRVKNISFSSYAGFIVHAFVSAVTKTSKWRLLRN